MPIVDTALFILVKFIFWFYPGCLTTGFIGVLHQTCFGVTANPFRLEMVCIYKSPLDTSFNCA